MLDYITKNLFPKITANKHRCFISLFWLLGLCAGTIFASSYPWDFLSDESVYENMVMSSNSLLAMILPILFGVVVCAISFPLLCLYFFLKGFAYAVISINITLAFADAGWLMRLLLLSTNTALIIAFLLFSLRNAGQERNIPKRNIFCLLIVFVLISAYYLHFEIPFTTLLLNG